MRRQLPNILITGTPGTGKSFLSFQISKATGLEWINIDELAKINNFYEDYDETLQCYVLDEDMVISELEDKMHEGGKIVDYHGCDFFPENWFDIIFVLTTDNTELYQRLTSRGYSKVKIENNIEAEIFQTLLDEAKEAYKENIVYALESNSLKDYCENIKQIAQWIEIFKNNPTNGSELASSFQGGKNHGKYQPEEISSVANIRSLFGIQPIRPIVR